MTIHVINMAYFEKIGDMRPDSGTHTVVRGKLAYSDKTWVCKRVSSEGIARSEVLAQEFNRLIIPGQPETRLAKDDDEHYFVLSEEVIDGKPLPLDKPARLTKGVYTGLGHILVASIFSHEIDLNTGNLLINRQNKIVKFDGDWSLAALMRPDVLRGQPAGITSNLLSQLPYLPNYFAYIWLDIRRFGESHPSTIFTDDLLLAPHYRAEIHQTILRILLLPESYMRVFFASYLIEDVDFFMGEFITRKSELKLSAMGLGSFCDYLTSVEAREIVQACFHDMNDFSVNTWFPVLQSDEREQFQLEFKLLQEQVMPKAHASPNTVTADLDGMVDIKGDEEERVTEASSVLNQHRLFRAKPSISSCDVVKRSSTCSDLASLTA